jgi:hypothetical protein
MKFPRDAQTPGNLEEVARGLKLTDQYASPLADSVKLPAFLASEAYWNPIWPPKAPLPPPSEFELRMRAHSEAMHREAKNSLGSVGAEVA